MKNDLASERSTEDADLEQLLRTVGPRDAPSAAATAAVHAAVHAEWRAVVDERRTQRSRRWLIGASIAAGIAAAVGITQLDLDPATRSQPMLVASVAKIQGATTGLVQVSQSGETWRDLRSGESLASGSWIRTDAATAVALKYGHEASVRLDRNSLLRLVATDRIVLERGRLYIDVPAGSPQRLVVQTQFGTLEHIGTQYQAQLANDGLTVSVREGRVAIAAARTRLETQAGEAVTLGVRGLIARERVEARDASWHWAALVAPGFEIEAQTLSAFLQWIARETGRTVNYASPQTRAAAESTVLHGSIGELTPEAALQAVLATTRFTWALRETSIDLRL